MPDGWFWQSALREKFAEPVLYATFVTLLFKIFAVSGSGAVAFLQRPLEPALSLAVVAGALISACLARSLFLRAVLQTGMAPALFLVFEGFIPDGVFDFFWVLYVPAFVFLAMTTFAYTIWTNALYFIALRVMRRT